MGLDLSLRKTGVAILQDNPLVPRLRLIEPKKLTAVHRLIYIRSELRSILEEEYLTGEVVVGLEGYSMGSRGRSYDIGELGGVVKTYLRENNYALVSIPPKTAKKFLTNNGNADKIEMMRAVREQTKLNFTDDNQCDAYVMANIASAVNEGKCAFVLTAERKKVLECLLKIAC